MSKQTNTAPDFDQLIIGLGEAIHYLVGEYNRMEEAGLGSTDHQEKIRAGHLEGDICHRINDLQIAVAAMPATSVESAAIQIRSLSHMNFWDPEDGENYRKRMLYSILNVLEANGGGTRDQWAGEFCIPLSSNPFNHTLKFDEALADSQAGKEVVS